MYAALAHQQTLTFDAEVAGQTDALPMVRRYVTGAQVWSSELNTQLRELGPGLLTTTANRETHAVL